MAVLPDILISAPREFVPQPAAQIQGEHPLDMQ